MPEHPDHFTIEATATYAVWPGQAFVCAKVSPARGTPAKLRFSDQWYLGNVETGQVTVLALYVFRRPR